MKPRAKKKWIPKNTSYCYDIKKRTCCKWHMINKNKEIQDNGYCFLLKTGDWFENGTSLLWDKCKECGISDGFSKNLKRPYKKKRKY